MEGVEFNEENEFYERAKKLYGRKDDPSMVKFMIKYNLVSSRTSAFVLLFLIIITFFTLTWYLLQGRSIGDDYVVGPDGTRYEIQEYLDLVDQGRDPLSPRAIREYNAQDFE